MSESGRDDFFVGYFPKMTAGLARAVRTRALLILLLTSGLAVLLAAMLPAIPGGRFEYGVTRQWEGRVYAMPYPQLVVADGEHPPRTFLLVARGKHGAQSLVRDLDGAVVEVEGSLIERDGQTMLELSGSPVRMEGTTMPAADAESLGPVTLEGEIVDSKCHLGVMVPGEGRTHRGCAVRCISGGAPPMLLAHDSAGATMRLLLTDASGGAVGPSVLDMVAVPVRISGMMSRRAGLLYLAADPSTWERIP